jgi:subtilisin family serine protease
MAQPRTPSRLVALVVAVVVASAVMATGSAASAAGSSDGSGSGAAAGTIDPVLRQQLAAAAPQQMVDAVVVLRSQTDLSGIKSGTRAQRVSSTVKALRNHATQTQKPLLDLLVQRRSQGLVSGVQPLWVANDIVVTATPAVIDELAARPEVREVRPNATVQAPPAAPASALTASATEPNISLVNAPALWDAGFRGQGVVVANMDTGVDVTHPDLAGKWRGGTNSWYDPNGQHPTTPTDVSGHGTQTMGVMVGGDAGGTSVGVAPDAKWIAVKIFADNGSATTAGIHLGFQWLLDPDGDPTTADAPNVVNASWTMTSPGCTLDFQPDLQSLRAAGILPVFATGNFGPTAGTVFAPANLPEAFAVGGTDGSDAIDPYSSRGPSACAGATAPKLVAPDTGIRTTDAFGGYVTDTGTSVAAPHVAGALALLLSARPSLTANQQEAALEAGAVDLGPVGPDADFGYGRLDVAAAYATLTPSPDFAVAVSPASRNALPGGSASYDVTVTGSGGFTGDVALSVTGLDPSVASGSATPATVTGGSGTASVTVTVAAGAAPGSYPFTVAGTSGATSHDATATLVVDAPPDFDVVATPTTQTVSPGGTGSFTATVTALHGFTGDVTLSLTGVPASVGTAAVSPSAVSAAGTAQVTVTTLGTAPAGSYPLTLDATSGTLHHTSSLTLVVSATAKDFTVSVVPSSLTVRRGRTAASTVHVSATGGFAGRVRLSVFGVPPGAFGRFGTVYLAAPGRTTLWVRTTAITPRGTFTLRVVATCGRMVRVTTVTLVVR